MPIQHKDIPDAQRHEPKGASTATSGQVWVADGAGSGSFATPASVVSLTPSVTPVSVAANTTAEQTLAVAGLATTDKLLAVVKPTAQAGLGIVGFRISATNTLAITYSNNTGAPIVPTAETYQVNVWRS